MQNKKGYFRKSKKEDLKYLYDNLKQSDIEELEILGYSPKSLIDDCFDNSKECYTIIHNEKPMGIFGVSHPEYSNVFKKEAVKIGLLTTSNLKNVKIQFIKETKDYLKSALQKYKILYNIVSIKNKDSIKLLKYLGFKFLYTVKINKEIFILFNMEFQQ